MVIHTMYGSYNQIIYNVYFVYIIVDNIFKIKEEEMLFYFEDI